MSKLLGYLLRKGARRFKCNVCGEVHLVSYDIPIADACNLFCMECDNVGMTLVTQ